MNMHLKICSTLFKTNCNINFNIKRFCLNIRVAHPGKIEWRDPRSVPGGIPGGIGGIPPGIPPGIMKQPGKTDLSPHSSLLGDITQERTSATLHIDNVKNISAVWPLALIRQQSSQILIVKIYMGTVNPS